MKKLLLLALLGALGTFLPMAQAAQENHRRIAFSSNRGNDPNVYDLWAVDPDGNNLTRLTNDQAFDLDAAWSPDGTTIAYASTKVDGNEHIFLMNPDGTNVRQLTAGNANEYQPAWSPDGHSIAFTSDRTGHPEIYVMHSDGSDVSQVTHTPDPELNHRAAFLDGDKIIYGHAPDANTFVGPFTMLTAHRNGTDAGDVTPAGLVAPDDPAVTMRAGHQVAFVDNFCSICDVSDVFTMNADGTNVRQLTSDFGNNLDPDWSPDGRAITFSHEDPPITFDHADIWTMSADGSHLFNVTNNPADDVEPAWGCPGKGGDCHS